MAQDLLMRFDPATGAEKPYPSHAAQYRTYHGAVAWLYNPWTGTPRDARDVGTDVMGHAIHDGSAQLLQQGPGLLWGGPTMPKPIIGGGGVIGVAQGGAGIAFGGCESQNHAKACGNQQRAY